ncbi:MAG: DNA-3-methyladenine glycosylase 2 family protein [Peptococcaceae bacterium]|nr:DNA-3-methyladenine glycosylase 2 family protein [Peptococcaceae bacterium]
MQYFEYGDLEIKYLKSKDKRLAEAMDRIGLVKRKVIPDLFSALVNSIVGQQISMKAHATIWQRILDKLGEVTPQAIQTLSAEELQSTGITMRKALYIKNIAQKILSGEFDMERLSGLPDHEVIKELSTLNGVGVWTAEMLMIFSMQRMNILSWNDLAIRRGIMKLYNYEQLDKQTFEKHRKRYSPYCSVASLYLWEISKENSK